MQFGVYTVLESGLKSSFQVVAQVFVKQYSISFLTKPSIHQKVWIKNAEYTLRYPLCGTCGAFTIAEQGDVYTSQEYSDISTRCLVVLISLNTTIILTALEFCFKPLRIQRKKNH